MDLLTLSVCCFECVLNVVPECFGGWGKDPLPGAANSLNCCEYSPNPKTIPPTPAVWFCLWACNIIQSEVFLNSQSSLVPSLTSAWVKVSCWLEIWCCVDWQWRKQELWMKLVSAAPRLLGLSWRCTLHERAPYEEKFFIWMMYLWNYCFHKLFLRETKEKEQAVGKTTVC